MKKKFSLNLIKHFHILKTIYEMKIENNSCFKLKFTINLSKTKQKN
jgi:hypothetical protein